jgi:hypothetical protein
MKYGPHSSEVEEILRFVDAGGALRPITHLQVEGARVVLNLDEAQGAAYSQHFDDEGMTWTDIRENEMAEVLSPTYSMPEWPAIEEALRQATASFFRTLQRQHGRQRWLNEVAADLRSIITNHAVFGASDSFFERLWRIYRQGGWPCGWDGSYPGGNLVVWEPPLVQG